MNPPSSGGVLLALPALANTNRAVVFQVLLCLHALEILSNLAVVGMSLCIDFLAEVSRTSGQDRSVASAVSRASRQAVLGILPAALTSGTVFDVVR